MTKILTDKITQVLDQMAPVRKIQIRKNFAPWLSPETKQLMRKRNNAQKRYLITREDQDERRFKNLRNQATNRLRKEKADWKKRKLEACVNDYEKIWKNILCWLSWKPASGPPNQISNNGQLLTKPSEIAECINNYFVTKLHVPGSSVWL